MAAAAAIIMAALAAPGTGTAVAAGNGQGPKTEKVCGPAAAGTARCHARVVVNSKGTPIAAGAPAPGSLGPADLQSAYGLPSATAGTGRVVALIDAYDAPSAEADLGVYRRQYGLSACTTANGCFRKVGQDGSSRLPKPNRGWAQETSLDLDMVSAICPNCRILLVEANSAKFTDLAAAVDTAARLGATAISNSYGGPEFSGEASYDSHYTHPGVAITVSSGDDGYGVEYPAASPAVTAVGGTSLTRSTAGWSESAWSGAGSGCSAYEAKPSWQHDTGCAKRTVADVAAIADPATGVAVYDTYAYQGSSGWMVFGGTSVASPIIASVYALAGDGAATASSLYAHASSLTDIVAGSNGSCTVPYLCSAGSGYDGPTGLGTPQGTQAF